MQPPLVVFDFRTMTSYATSDPERRKQLVALEAAARNQHSASSLARVKH